MSSVLRRILPPSLQPRRRTLRMPSPLRVTGVGRGRLDSRRPPRCVLVLASLACVVVLRVAPPYAQRRARCVRARGCDCSA